LSLERRSRLSWLKLRRSRALKRSSGLARLMAGKGKRGIPAGVYIVVRSIFDKRSEEELKYYEALQRLAQEKGMDVAEYAKKVIVEHVKSVVGG